MKNRRRGFRGRVASFLLFMVPAGICLKGLVFGQDAAQIRAATGITSGLCVRYGTTDGKLEVGLADSGRMLVHGLALDNISLKASRRTALDAGMHPLVSFERVINPGSLPYADNMVNLFVADLDAAGPAAPSTAEIDRVLEPGGVAYVKKGTWQKTVKPPPAGIDPEWNHFCYGPEGNALTKDRVVKPSTSLKWIQGWRSPDLRLTSGMVVHAVGPVGPKNGGNGYLCGRDAYNGLGVWKRDFPCNQYESNYYTTIQKYSFTCTPEGVFYYPARPWYPRWPDIIKHYALRADAHTGKLLNTYSNGLTSGDSIYLREPRGKPYLLVAGGKLIQTLHEKLAVLDIGTGALLRRWTAPQYIGTIAATGDGDTVFLQETPVPDGYTARWEEVTYTTAVTCLGKDGNIIWRNTDTAVTKGISQIIKYGDRIVLFNSLTNMGGDIDSTINRGRGGMVCLGASDGHILWKSAPFSPYLLHWNNAVIRDTTVYEWGPFFNFRTYSLNTGVESPLPGSGYNQRCTRMIATPDWVVFGFISWASRNPGIGFQQSVGRGECSLSPYAANGQMYWNPNLACACINGVRGIVSVCSDADRAPVADAKRLEGTDGGAGAMTPGTDPSPLYTASMIAGEWRGDSIFQFIRGDTTPWVRFRDLDIRGDIHLHRVTARRAGADAWRFVAGGRVYAKPLVNGTDCFVASADGWVYCLDAASGAVRWRFMAAPSQRTIVINGQLESAWPVYGMTMHEGKLCFSAGRHAELDGGIYLYGIDPGTGALAWKVNLYIPAAPVAGWNKGMPDLKMEIVWSTPVNGYLASDSGRLFLVSPRWHKDGSSASVNGFYFDETGRTEILSSNLFAVQTAAWNGQTVNPRTLSPVAVLDGRENGAAARAAPGRGAALGLGWFRTGAAGKARVTLIDAAGRTAATLFDGAAETGVTRFDARFDNLPGGWYLMVMRTGGSTRWMEIVRR